MALHTKEAASRFESPPPELGQELRVAIPGLACLLYEPAASFLAVRFSPVVLGETLVVRTGRLSRYFQLFGPAREHRDDIVCATATLEAGLN